MELSITWVGSEAAVSYEIIERSMSVADEELGQIVEMFANISCSKKHRGFLFVEDLDRIQMRLPPFMILHCPSLLALAQGLKYSFDFGLDTREHILSGLLGFPTEGARAVSAAT